MQKVSLRRIWLPVLMLLATANAVADDWVSHYYEKPAPGRFVAEVQALSKAGHLAKPTTAEITSVFLGRVMAANPSQVDGWLNQLGDLKNEDRQTLLLAASRSGTKEAQAYLARQPEADKFGARPADVRDLAPTGIVLDMLWADFFATGEAAPLRKIVSALQYSEHSGALERYATSAKTNKDRDDAMLDATFKAAMWSLQSNAKQHRKVGEILEQFYFADGLSQPEQLFLGVVLAKALPEKFVLTREQAGKWIFKRK
jgi:hypothetical protein